MRSDFSSQQNVLTFSPLTGGCSEGLDARPGRCPTMLSRGENPTAGMGGRERRREQGQERGQG